MKNKAESQSLATLEPIPVKSNLVPSSSIKPTAEKPKSYYLRQKVSVVTVNPSVESLKKLEEWDKVFQT